MSAPRGPRSAPRRPLDALRRLAGDARLLLEYATTGGIAQGYARDISSRDYWDGHVAMMEAHYLKRPPEEARREQAEYDFIAERLRAALPAAGAAVLDVGTGFGHSLRQLAARVPARWHGCDFSAALIERARQHCAAMSPPPDLFVWDLREDAPAALRGARLDAVTAHGVLTCLAAADAAAALRRMAGLAPRILLAELDFSGLTFLETLRFRKERGYAIHDYRAIIAGLDAPLRLDAAHELGRLTGGDPRLMLYEVGAAP